MYFIVEQKDQLEKMLVQSSCFVQVISANDNYHPKLSSVSLIYYNDFKKGYIFVIDHTEGFSLDKKSVENFLNQHEKIYVLDSKYHSYFLHLKNTIDLHYTIMNRSGIYEEIDCLTHLHKGFYQTNFGDPWINKIIPIGKHYERWECVMEKISELVGLETEVDIENKMSEAYKFVEQSGLRIDKKRFHEKYKINHEHIFIKDDIVYNSYNLYNLTGRPTNAFNGVNFLAIPKEDDYRSCFIPRNDVLVEFDFDAYHLRLIANIIDFKCPQESMHQYLGKIYYNKQELTDDEYKSAKEITFKQLYGGIEKQYSHIEFFSSLNNFIDKEWKKYNKFGATILSTGRVIKKKDGMSKLRLFNYIVQNLETKNNIDRILDIKKYLKNKKTKLVLITYDSFLFDYSVSDGKQTLIDIKNMLEKQNMLVKYKYGKNYSF